MRDNFEKKSSVYSIFLKRFEIKYLPYRFFFHEMRSTSFRASLSILSAHVIESGLILNRPSEIDLILFFFEISDLAWPQLNLKPKIKIWHFLRKGYELKCPQMTSGLRFFESLGHKLNVEIHLSCSL